MKNDIISRKSQMALTAALLLSLAACGGGGNGGSAPSGGTGPVGETPVTPPTTTTPGQLSGVVATGAPFAGAAITVTDQTGATVCTTTTDTKGFYGCDLPASTKAPLVIRASRDEQTLYSTTASVATGTTNVTPLTTIVVAQLSPNGDPSKLSGAIQTTPSTVTADTIKAQVTELLTALQPLLSALGQTIDPMSGVFAADGTGQDRVLDTLLVSVRPDGTAANIEITVKAVPGSSGEPLSISYRTTDTTPALPAVTAAQLDDVPTPALVAAFLKRLDDCYALPLTQRVSTATSDSQDAIGTAADVSAPVCRQLFVDDNPATFVSNGGTVGRNAQGRGAYSSLFRFGPTGLKHDRGNFEFFRVRGEQKDLVLSYRWTDTLGNTDNDTLVVRNQGGVLKLTGNTNTYTASVRPVAEDREYLNMPTFNAYTTGYNISIDNRIGSNNQSVFEKVEVTTPWNQVITFKPNPGLSYLVADREDGTPTVTSIVRLATGYADAATTGNLAEKELNIFFVNPQYSEEAIRALKDQSVWRMKFHVAGGEPVEQSYRTLSRALTIGEIRNIQFAQLTAASRAELLAETAANGRITFGAPSANDPNTIDFSAEGDLDAWTVPAGALAPTSFSVTGRGPSPSQGVQGARFNDGTTVRNTARKAIIYCSPQSVEDTHCYSATPGTGPFQYAQGSFFNAMELWARSARQVEMKKQIGLYKSF